MKISSSPHIRDKETTGNIMGQVIVALLPATIFGISNFGVSALITILITVISCVIFEAGYQKLFGLKITVNTLFSAGTIDRASLRAIINGIAEVETTQTLTLGATLRAKLTEEDIAIATAKNWSIA